MPSLSDRGPWIHYKRFSDNKQVSARLVLRQQDEAKMIEVKETHMGDFHCPKCDELLNQGDTGAFPNVFLRPEIFHERHRPID